MKRATTAVLCVVSVVAAVVMAYGCTSTSSFVQQTDTSSHFTIGSFAIPSAPYIKSMYSQSTQDSDLKITSFTVESQLFYSLVDTSKLAGTVYNAETIDGLSQLFKKGLLPKTLDPDGKGYYQTTLTWQQMDQAVTLTLLMGCLEQSFDKYRDQPIPTDGSERSPYAIANCITLSPGTISANKSTLYVSKNSAHEYFDDRYKILLDIDYTLGNAENHLAGELSFDPYFNAKGSLRGAICTLNCANTTHSNLGSNESAVDCTYSCDNQIGGDFSYSYGSASDTGGPGDVNEYCYESSHCIRSAFYGDYSKKSPPPPKVEFVAPENKKFTYVYDPYSPIDPYAKP